MRRSQGGEDDRTDSETRRSASAAEGISTGRGEATDPQLCLWGSTRVLADKAVAPYMGEVPWDEE